MPWSVHLLKKLRLSSHMLRKVSYALRRRIQNNGIRRDTSSITSRLLVVWFWEKDEHYATNHMKILHVLLCAVRNHTRVHDLFITFTRKRNNETCTYYCKMLFFRKEWKSLLKPWICIMHSCVQARNQGGRSPP